MGLGVARLCGPWSVRVYAFSWVAVKDLELSYYSKETLLFANSAQVSG